MEETLWDLFGEEASDQQGLLPPGFRFHPTDEELVTYYLASKVFNGGILCGVEILEVDLNRCEPWELPEAAKMGEREWYFYTLRDRKYPTGLRTNRATGAGYWKATGKDREVRVAATAALVGMKKTLVFYRGRAPRGEKTKWVLHEYRLDGLLSSSTRHACKEEWVICRIFHKCTSEKKKSSNPYCPSSLPSSTNTRSNNKAASNNFFLEYPSSSSSSSTTVPNYNTFFPTIAPPTFDHNQHHYFQTLAETNYSYQLQNLFNNMNSQSSSSINGNHEAAATPTPLKLPETLPSTKHEEEEDEDAVMMPSWFESYLRTNPLLYEMGLYDHIMQSGPLVP